MSASQRPRSRSRRVPRRNPSAMMNANTRRNGDDYGSRHFLRRMRRAPYPQLGPLGTREDFDFVRRDVDGRPAESPASGEWFGSRHFESVSGSYRITAEWALASAESAHSKATS
jgi:hypothetical protein